MTHAYQTFFDRTIANFEALVEGRDIRIGRPVDEPAPVTGEQLMPLLQRIGEIAVPLLQQLARQHDRQQPMTVTASTQMALSTSFRHRRHSPTGATDTDQWIAEFTRFIDGLSRPSQRDLTLLAPAA